MTVTLTLSHNDQIVKLFNVSEIIHYKNRTIEFKNFINTEIKKYDLLDIQYIKLDLREDL